jgi:hypothetical protein
MLVKGDSSGLLDTFEQLLRLATQANLLSSDTSLVSSAEMHAAARLMGLRCEGCGSAGFTTVACAACSTLPRVDSSTDGPGYYAARETWKGKDKARASLSAVELNKQFKLSAEYQQFMVSSQASATASVSGSSKAITAEACITYVKKNQNKLPMPLEPPTFSYR